MDCREPLTVSLDAGTAPGKRAMSEAMLVGGAVVVGAPAVWLWQHRRRRRQIYRELSHPSLEVRPVEEPVLQLPDATRSLSTEFCLTSVVRMENIFDASSLEL